MGRQLLQATIYMTLACMMSKMSIHQIWLSDNPIPESMEMYHKKIMSIHGTENLRLWKDKECLDLAKEFGLDETYNSWHHWVYKADIARVLIVFKYGGWYLDMDVELWKPLFEPDRFTIIQGYNYAIENAVFHAKPKHPILSRYIHRLTKLNTRRGNPINLTGRVAMRSCFGNSDINIISEEEFSEYGKHHYKNTWMSGNPKQDAETFLKGGTLYDRKRTERSCRNHAWRRDA